MSQGGLPPHLVDVDEDVMFDDAAGLVADAKSRGVTLRILGAMAVYSHSRGTQAHGLIRRLERLEGKPQLFTDIDFAGYSRERKEIGRFLESRGFKPAVTINAFFGNRRLIYYHPANKYSVDIFLDKLEFSHDVNFGDRPGRGRLELDYPTITLADVVMEKLQIHEINRKDLVDLIVLLSGHDVAAGPLPEMIDGAYISQVMSDDWGFWYECKLNLQKLEAFASSLHTEGKLSDEGVAVVKERAERLWAMIDSAPKTKGWQKRADKGAEKPWFRVVEDVDR
jgi:hypothetical protein